MRYFNQCETQQSNIQYYQSPVVT